MSGNADGISRPLHWAEQAIPKGLGQDLQSQMASTETCNCFAVAGQKFQSIGNTWFIFCEMSGL